MATSIKDFLIEKTSNIRMKLSDILNRGPLDWMDDEHYLKFMWFLRYAKPLNLKNPQTINEKLQWLKLYYRKPEYSILSDKLKAKELIAEKVGTEYLLPTLGHWEHFRDISFDTLPDSFVLKTNHDNSGVLVVRDKSQFDKHAAEIFLEKHLKKNFYKRWREWVYKDIKPCILAEQLLENPDKSPLIDYKFFCFNGEPKICYSYLRSPSYQGKELTYYDGTPTFTSFDLKKHHAICTYYDENYEIIPCTRRPEPAFVNYKMKPQNLELMRELSRKLSAGIPHVRVDFYEVNGKVYIGELTFYTGAGMVDFIPDKYNKIFGDYLDLPKDLIR